MARVAVFVEDRLFQDSGSEVLTFNRHLEGLTWRDLGPESHDSVLCARITRVDAPSAAHQVDGEISGLPYYRGLLGGMLRLPRLFWRTLLIARSADLVVVKCPGLVGTTALIAARALRRPVAMHFVGDIEDSVSDSRNSASSRQIKWIARRLSQWAVRQAGAVRYPTRSFLQEKYPASRPDREFWYTDAGVTAVDHSVAESMHVPGRIVAIGTQDRMYKGHDFLIRAMPAVLEQVPGAHLVLVGKGSCREELVALAADIGVSGSVEFIDFLDGWPHVSDMMLSAHVFAMPSMAEGLPRALLEAMSLGVACIGSDASGIPELLPHHLLVPRGSVEPLERLLIRVLTDDVFRQRAADECLESSRHFNADIMEKNMKLWQRQLAQMIDD